MPAITEATGNQDELARQCKDRAAALLARGKLEAALGEYQRAVQAAPRDVMSRRKVAELLARLGRNGEAVRAYQLLAGRFAAEGRLLEAIALCKVVLQLDPRHEETQGTLSRLYAQRGSSPGTLRERMPDAMSGAIDFSHARAARTALPKPLLALPDSPPGPRTPPGATFDSNISFDSSAPDSSGVEVEVQLSDLPQTPLFSQLPQEVMQVLLERLTMLPFAAGETIIREGEPGRSLFVIASGSAQVVRGQGEAREVLDTLPDGAFFGEIGLVADVPRLASVVALEDSVLLEVSRELVASLGARFPELEGLVRTFYKSRLLANLLRSNALFAQLEPAERGQLVEKFSVLRAAPGEVLLKQGAEGRGLFLLLRGRCGVTGRDSSGVEHPLPEMGEGAVMGEISLLSQKPVTATVTALTESVLLFLEPGPFVEHLLSNPRAREMVTRLSQERLQRSEALEQAAIEPAFL